MRVRHAPPGPAPAADYGAVHRVLRAEPVGSTITGDPAEPSPFQACGCPPGVWRWWTRNEDGDLAFAIDECVRCGAVWRTLYRCGHCGGPGCRRCQGGWL